MSVHRNHSNVVICIFLLRYKNRFIHLFFTIVILLIESMSSAQSRCFVPFYPYSGKVVNNYENNIFYPNCKNYFRLGVDTNMFQFGRVLCAGDTSICSLIMKRDQDSNWLFMSDTGLALFYSHKSKSYSPIKIANKLIVASRDTLYFRNKRLICLIDVFISEDTEWKHFSRFGFNENDNIVYFKGDVFHFIWEDYLKSEH